MRYVTRQALRDANVPKKAIILDETPQQISYAFDGKIIVLRVFEVPGSCDGCTTLYWATVALTLVVADVLKKMGIKQASRKPRKKLSTKKKSDAQAEDKNT